MKYHLTALSWLDRVLCGWLHNHLVTIDRDGTEHRKCQVFGCGMLVVRHSPIARRMRAARKAASRLLSGSWHG